MRIKTNSVELMNWISLISISIFYSSSSTKDNWKFQIFDIKGIKDARIILDWNKKLQAHFAFHSALSQLTFSRFAGCFDFNSRMFHCIMFCYQTFPSSFSTASVRYIIPWWWAFRFFMALYSLICCMSLYYQDLFNRLIMPFLINKLHLQ